MYQTLIKLFQVEMGLHLRVIVRVLLNLNRKPRNEIVRLALDWIPQGSGGQGRPKVAWIRTVLEEAKIIGKSWNEIKHTARNRVRWKNLVEALCSEME
jgi:hypothetical protein